MSNMNSSGSCERFTLAPGENKTFVNDDTGSNYATVDLHGDDQAAAAVTVTLQTSEDGDSFDDVDDVDVQPRGSAPCSGATGKYTRVENTTGADIVHVIVHLRNRAQIVEAL